MREAIKILVTVIGATAALWWLPPEYAKRLADVGGRGRFPVWGSECATEHRPWRPGKSATLAWHEGCSTASCRADGACLPKRGRQSDGRGVRASPPRGHRSPPYRPRAPRRLPSLQPRGNRPAAAPLRRARVSGVPRVRASFGGFHPPGLRRLPARVDPGLQLQDAPLVPVVRGEAHGRWRGAFPRPRAPGPAVPPGRSQPAVRSPRAARLSAEGRERGGAPHRRYGDGLATSTRVRARGWGVGAAAVRRQPQCPSARPHARSRWSVA